MLALAARMAVVLGSVCLNARMVPANSPTEVHAFVCSVLVLVAVAETLLLTVLRVAVQYAFGVRVNLHLNALLAPLASALRTKLSNRHGDFDGDGRQKDALFVPTDRRVLDDERSESGRACGPAPEPDADAHMAPPMGTAALAFADARGGADDSRFDDRSDSSAPDDVDDIFFGDIGLVAQERANVYSDVYVLGVAAFCMCYAVDTVSPVPAFSLLLGLSFASIRDVVAVAQALLRGSPVLQLGIARILALFAFLTAFVAQLCLLAALLFESADETELVGLQSYFATVSMLNATLSVVLPLLSPCMLLYISPKRQPLTTIQEASPFVATMAFWYIAFFLSLRGFMSSALYPSTNGTAIDVELFVQEDFHLDTAVDHGYNIPWILLSPVLKVLCVSIILAAIINRRNLEVICPVQCVLCLRELLRAQHETALAHYPATHHTTRVRLDALALFFTGLAGAAALGKGWLWRNVDPARGASGPVA